jgi:hypothetical protein
MHTHSLIFILFSLIQLDLLVGFIAFNLPDMAST